MSTDVRAPGVPPPTINLGMSPLMVALARFAGFGMAGVVLGCIAAANGGTAAALVLFLGLPWSVLMLYLGIRLIVLAAVGGGTAFRRTKAAVASGELGGTYFVKGNDHIAVIDEPGRRICVNGDVIGFDRIRNLTWASNGNKHQLTFVLDSGENPVRNVDLYNANELKVAFERISNSLRLR